jgi:hypothetical protein
VLAGLLLASGLVAAIAAAPALAAGDPIGSVAAVRGEAFARAEQDTERRALAPGDIVHRDEILTTGVNARLHVDLTDGGALQLGENAAFVVNSAALGQPSFGAEAAMQLFAGPFRLIGNHEGTRIRTPLASIGIRGTDVWGGFIDGGFGILLSDGVIDVTTALGRATLDQPGQGVTVPGRGAPPGPVTVWPLDKVSRAIATVALDDR